MERLTLLLNHVLAAEPAATSRLRAHAGAVVRVQLEGWPSLLPAPPDFRFRLTPAGLLEWCGAEMPGETPALLLSCDASNPALLFARGLVGERPKVDVQGDAALAADASWVLDNVRWDVRDDLSRLVGPAWAERLGRLGAALAAGLRQALRAVSAERERRGAERERPGPERERPAAGGERRGAEGERRPG